MATTEQRFEHLSFKAAPPRSPAVAGGWYRLILALAAVVALVAWGLANPSDGQRSHADRLGSSATSADQQTYDGHGKWGGYLPQ